MSNQGMWRILERLAARNDGLGPFLRGMVQSPLFYQTESAAIKIGASCFGKRNAALGPSRRPDSRLTTYLQEADDYDIACRNAWHAANAKRSEGKKNRKVRTM